MLLSLVFRFRFCEREKSAIQVFQCNHSSSNDDWYYATMILHIQGGRWGTSSSRGKTHNHRLQTRHDGADSSFNQHSRVSSAIVIDVFVFAIRKIGALELKLSSQSVILVKEYSIQFQKENHCAETIFSFNQKYSRMLSTN